MKEVHWPEVDLGGSASRGGMSDLGKHMKQESLQKEYLKEYFTGGSASKGRHFGRSLVGVLQQEPNRMTNDNVKQNHGTVMELMIQYSFHQAQLKFERISRIHQLFKKLSSEQNWIFC